jgi:hypothetical protein
MQSHLLYCFKRFNPELPTWDDLVVGYDFSFLEPLEIQTWAKEQGCRGEAVEAMMSLSGLALLDFEIHLWRAVAEQTGKTPRPGNLRWIRAQDRWRLALLKDALAMELTPAALAKSIEVIYDRVGSPEDMLALFTPAAPWTGKSATVDVQAVVAFLMKMEKRRDQDAVKTA